MKLMVNKYLIFDEIEVENLNKTLKNFTRMSTLPDFPKKYYSDTYLLSTSVDDNTRFENIAQELYEDTDYWDFLMVFNGMTNMNQLPVDYNQILERVSVRLAEWRSKTEYLNQSSYSENKIENMRQKMLDEEIAKNEKFRIIKYISESDLSELMTDLLEAKNNPKLNTDLIINKEV